MNKEREELELMARALREMGPGHYFEIGIFVGRGLRFALENTPPDSWVFGIDSYLPHLYTANIPKDKRPEHTEHPAVTAWNSMRNAGDVAAGRVCLLPCSSEGFVDTPIFEWMRGKIGFLFIDGGHTYDQVILDASYIDLVVPGGFVAFHDYRPDAEGFEGCVRGIDESIKRYGLIPYGRAGSLVICKTRSADNV